MELITGLAAWIVAIVMAAFVAWLKGFFKQALPPPRRARLAIANALEVRSPLPEERFRLVLCWLEDDSSGRDTGTVAEAFTGIEGIELVRSARVVSAPGAADDWRPAMQKGALAAFSHQRHCDGLRGVAIGAEARNPRQRGGGRPVRALYAADHDRRKVRFWGCCPL